jgi:hypothetical protein
MEVRTSASHADVNSAGTAWRVTGIREGDTHPMSTTTPLMAQVRAEFWTSDRYEPIFFHPDAARQLAAHLTEMAEHANGAPSFTCPRCDRTSYHPDDQRAGYCGACHHYTGDTTP